jgi:serine/threonine protein kinase/tetratricopeptide (TPR) repeat protein
LQWSFPGAFEDFCPLYIMNPTSPNSDPNAAPEPESDSGCLPFESIHDLCTTFAHDSDSPNRPAIHEYVRKVAEAARPTLLRNLLHIEVARRRATGERPTADEYVHAMPYHATLIKQVFLESTSFSSVEYTSQSNEAPTGLFQVPPAGHLGGYRLVRELGRGGMGAVYEAIHLQRGHRVALKTLPALDGSKLHRFKREFRALTHVNHPNLIGLHSLESDGSHWFLTMDLIQGTDFLSYVRPKDVLDETRLRKALSQLVAGVLALHGQHIIHRDLKPSNVMVSTDERVIILDFGLVLEDFREGLVTSADVVAGTPRYMAPEQGLSGKVTGASDWYAVGVMLYEALSGQLPYQGSHAMELLRKKIDQDPSPLPIDCNAPADLAELAMRLLARDANQRPDAFEIATKVSGVATQRVDSPRSNSGSLLVGRQSQMQQIQAALHHTRSEQKSCAVFIHGLSGEGKTTLVEHFLERCRGQDRELTILSGRCYDRESVPFKAIDNLIDSLTSYLKNLSVADAAILMPDDIGFLSQLFPVLQRVEAVGRMTPKKISQLDAQQVRTRAFNALRSLLLRITRTAPVILVCDDLQWGDIDSAEALFEVLRAPESPAVLFIGTYRRDEAESSPFLQRWRSLSLANSDQINAREVAVGPLDVTECTQLLIAMLGQDTEAIRRRASAFTQQSGGNPYLLTELVGCYDPAADSFQAIPIHEVIDNKLARLPPQARDLLELISVSGQSLALDEATLAAGHDAEGLAILTHIRSEKLVRLVGREDSPMVDTYHDKIRETVLERLETSHRQSWHRSLAYVIATASNGALTEEQLSALEECRLENLTSTARLYDLAYHFDAAGDARRACVYAMLAAEHAATLFSHQVAVEQFAIAKRNINPSLEKLRFRIARGQGRSLSLLGRYEEGLAAMEGADAWTPDSVQQAQILGLRAEIHHKLGNIRQGVTLYSAALRKLGYWVPESFFGLLFGLARESWIQVLHEFLPKRWYAKDRPPSPSESLAVELANRNSIVSYYYNGLRMVWTHIKGVNLAEIRQESLGLAYAYGLHPAPMSVAGLGKRGLHRSDIALTIANRNADLMIEGHTYAMRSMANYTLTRFKQSIAEGDRAVEILKRTGDPYLLFIAESHITLSGRRLLELERAMETGVLCFERSIQLGEDASAGLVLMTLAAASCGNIPFSELRSYIDLDEGDHFTRVMLGWSQGMWHLHHERWEEASSTLWQACKVARENFLLNSYTAELASWCITAQRTYAMSLPDGREKRRQMRRAWSICRAAGWLSVLFAHEKAHVLRERAHLHMAEGRAIKAIKLLKKSVSIAESQHDLFQRNLSALALAQYESEQNVADAKERWEAEEALRLDVKRRIEEFRRSKWPGLRA